MTDQYGNVKEVHPFELKGKTIDDVYDAAANVIVITFTDGTKVRILTYGAEIHIKKG